MLRNINEIIGYELLIEGKSVGNCKDLLFDDDCWTIRYLLADTGKWLFDKKVLISPLMISNPDWSARIINLNISKEQLEDCPSQTVDEPVSREYEEKINQFFGYPSYWSSNGLWGHAAFPTDLSISLASEFDEDIPNLLKLMIDEKNHLRSFKKVKGYSINALNGDIGHLEDIIVDDQTWALRYIVVDTRNWFPGGKKVMLSLNWVEAISWLNSNFSVNLSKEKIKESPEFDPGKPIKSKYEKRLINDNYFFPVTTIKIPVFHSI